jgi:hypothetical protein
MSNQNIPIDSSLNETPQYSTSYTLTDITNISCQGTSFPTLLHAIAYALVLQKKYGLCKDFAIGQYTEKGHKMIGRWFSAT